MAIITISRGSMSGGAALARCLGTFLGYPVLAREVLVEAAAKLGVPEEVLRKNIQSSESPFEILREDRKIFLCALQSALANRCASGNLIYHGNAGQFLLKGLPTLLRVRLIAPRAVRIRTLVEHQALDPAAAREYIRNVDQERVEWTKFVYGADWRDPKNYDLVLNLENVSLETACGIVSHTVTLPAYRTTPPVLEAIRDFGLACRVQLALAIEPALRGIQCEVHAHHGKVDIAWHRAADGLKAGPPGSPEAGIRQAATKVEGIREVTLHFRESGRPGKVA